MPYDYVRPLATSGPAAIQYGMPVDSTYGYARIDALEDTLAASERHGKLAATFTLDREGLDRRAKDSPCAARCARSVAIYCPFSFFFPARGGCE
ncbi:MAG TPA: hypothetical protein VHC91_22965 [Trinickia sp.]|uniref:hypothetical protein n=1 Tax=Trinickia sp. TaxID=2571163 RepID=UPI002CFA1EA0|nr:hypothetical protein [Trinickia sp.]HVW53229.1 hypothetical protein [Trinickia sp.]